MKKRKMKNTAFKVFMVVYVLILLFAAVYCLSKLWTYAEEYEGSRPLPVIEAYVTDLNENRWNDAIAATIAAMPHELQSDEDCKAVVQALLKEKVRYLRIPGSAESTLNYQLKSGDLVLGTVKLEQDRSKQDELEFDMLPWIITEESYNFNWLYTSVEVTVPDFYSVALNGITLDDSYLIEDKIPYDMLVDLYGSYPNLPTKKTYCYDHVFGELTPVIYDEKGELADPTLLEDEGAFLMLRDEAKLARFNDFLGEFVERYTVYTSGAGNDIEALYKRLAPYLEPGSDFADRMEEAAPGLIYAKAVSAKVNSLEVNSILDLGDNTYLCYYTVEIDVARRSKNMVSTNNVRIFVIDHDNDLRVFEYEMY